MNQMISDFLDRHGLNPMIIDPPRAAEKICEHMKSGISGKIIDMPMIPTYLTADGAEPENVNAIVIDAGGTNYRCGIAAFHGGKCTVSDITVARMPGTDTPASWEEFISFVADSIEPFLGRADRIGFCFSYSAEITPEKDGLVNGIDKEVIITGCEGKRIGESLNAELNARGYSSKKIVVINDTVAALFGGSAELDKSAYSDLCGMICGTGFNVCLNHEGMIYNCEAGFYNGVPRGDVDRELDRCSQQPGEKLLEKMVSGAYIGRICRLALEYAEKEGCIAQGFAERAEKLESFDGATVFDLASGIDTFSLFARPEDLEFAREVGLAIFRRSARCAASAVIAVMLLNGSGTSKDRPMCVCAEGSLIAKSRFFREELFSALEEYAEREMNLYCRIVLGSGTTLPGSASAVLIN